MYAIIETGGKQYKVEKGDVLRVEKLAAEVGEEVTFEAIYTCSGKTVRVGSPIVKGIKVKAEVKAHGKGDKVLVFKYKPKKTYRKMQGHRQPYTEIEILSVGRAAAKKADAEETAEKAAAE